MTEVSPPDGAQPSLPQPTAAEVDSNDPKVQSAVAFLKDSRVRLTPNDAKVRFLKGKGLSPSQIKAAFDQTGQKVSMEMITDAYAKSNSTPSRSFTAPGGAAQGSVTTLAAGPPTSYSSGLGTRAAPPPRTHNLYTASPMELEQTPPSSWDWRDVVIGTAAAVMAAVGGVKLFQHYAPYELRRKGEVRAAPAFGRRPCGHRPLQPRSRGGMSSDTEGDRGFGHAAAIPRDVVGAPLAGLPPAGTPPPLPPAPPGLNKDEEVKRLEKELADAKAALEEKGKRVAEQAVSVATLRNDKNRLVQKIEKQSQEIENLKETIEKMEKEKEEKEKREQMSEEGAEGGNEVDDAKKAEDGDKDENGETAPEEVFAPKVFGNDAGEALPPEMVGMLPKPETPAETTAAATVPVPEPAAQSLPAADFDDDGCDVQPPTPPARAAEAPKADALSFSSPEANGGNATVEQVLSPVV